MKRLAWLLALLTAGCSSGGSAGFSNLPPARDAQIAIANPTRISIDATISPIEMGSASFRLLVPGRHRSRAALRRYPAYVSASTSKVVVTVRSINQRKPGKPQTFACTAACTGKVRAPIGVDAMTMLLEDAHSHVLARGSATFLILKSRGNTLDFTLDGVVAAVGITPVPATLPVVPAAQGYALFDAVDADGNTITPDGSYVDASGKSLAFRVASSNAALALGITTVSAPGTVIPFTYNGSAHSGAITLTPSLEPGLTTKPPATYAAKIALVPAIAQRLQPPVPMQTLMATQAATGTCGTCYNPNEIFVAGNSGGNATFLDYNLTSGAYDIAWIAPGGGPFTLPPIDAYQQVSGYTSFGYDYFGDDIENSTGGSNGAPSLNPCTSGVPIGETATGLYCQENNGAGIDNQTAGTSAGPGLVRLIRTIDGTDYFVVNYSNIEQQPTVVYNSSQVFAGAISVGENASTSSTNYFGNLDGSVTTFAGGTVAQFSHPVASVTGNGSSVFVYERTGVFGCSTPSGTFESAVLPIGNVIEIFTGVNGAPTLVESDGTLDVMAI